MPTPVTYNVDALKRLRDDITIEAKAGKHNQAIWGLLEVDAMRGAVTTSIADEDCLATDVLLVSCPTAACAAGWTVVAAGAKMIFYPGIDYAFNCVTTDGAIYEIATYAEHILGLNSHEAAQLFDPSISTEDVLRMIDEILAAAERNEPWDWLAPSASPCHDDCAITRMRELIRAQR